MDGPNNGEPLVATRMTEVKPSAEPNPSQRIPEATDLHGAAGLDPRQQALREACQLANRLKEHASALTQRNLSKGTKDPMTVAQGRNAIEKALEDVERLIHQLETELDTREHSNEGFVVQA